MVVSSDNTARNAQFADVNEDIIWVKKLIKLHKKASANRWGFFMNSIYHIIILKKDIYNL